MAEGRTKKAAAATPTPTASTVAILSVRCENVVYVGFPLTGRVGGDMLQQLFGFPARTVSEVTRSSPNMEGE
jgi:hypothetical protein